MSLLDRLYGAAVGTGRTALLLAREALVRGTQYAHLHLPWTRQPPGSTVPIRFQRPAVQYPLARIIVSRHSAWLFGEDYFPEVLFRPSDGSDPAPVNAWLGQLVAESKLRKVAPRWARGGLVRGSACLAWQVIRGELRVYPMPTQQLLPVFDALDGERLVSLERRYRFTQNEQAVEQGQSVQRRVSYLYRERLTEAEHIRYVPLRASDGEPSEWPIERAVAHDFGFVPAVWARIDALDDTESEDGDGVLMGLEPLIEDVDRLLNLTARALHYNQDPIRVLHEAAAELARPGVPLPPAALSSGAAWSTRPDAQAATAMGRQTAGRRSRC